VNDFKGLPLSVEFITGRVLLTDNELLYGYSCKWIDERASIAIALSQYERGCATRITEKIALLLDSERFKIGDMAHSLSRDGSVDAGVERVWLYLFLAWLYEADDSPQSFEIVDEIYADFGYPEAIEGFVSYMPSPPGRAGGPSGMDERWRLFVDSEDKYFRDRRLD